jgi:hypothetical protein
LNDLDIVRDYRTSKLQQMFQDIGVSKNLIDQYRTYCETRKLENIGEKQIIETDSFILFY